MTELKKPMGLTEVEFIPDDSTPVRKTILNFVELGVDMAKVDWKENYGNPSSAAASLKGAILADKSLKGVIDVCKRADNIYLYRVGKRIIG